MDGLLYEVVEAVEHDVDVLREGGLVEDQGEVDVNLGIGSDELAEVTLFFPRSHGVALDDAVRLVTLEPGVDEREQQAVAEEQIVARFEIATHALRIDDEPVHD